MLQEQEQKIWAMFHSSCCSRLTNKVPFSRLSSFRVSNHFILFVVCVVLARSVRFESNPQFFIDMRWSHFVHQKRQQITHKGVWSQWKTSAEERFRFGKVEYFVLWVLVVWFSYASVFLNTDRAQQNYRTKWLNKTALLPLKTQSLSLSICL